MNSQDTNLFHEKLNTIGVEVIDADEETYDLFSHELPQSNLGMFNEKPATLSVEIAGVQYELRQSPGLLTSSNAEGTTGAALWKISPLIAEWLEDQSNVLWSLGLLRADSVLVELGCGITGLIGLVMAPKVSTYVLTDQRSVLKLLQENINNNLHLLKKQKFKGRTSQKQGLSSGASSSPHAAELNWETDHAEALDVVLGPSQDVDMIVVCDCVFNDFLLEPLVTMCREICQRSRDKKTVLLIAQQLRSDQVFSAFIELLLSSFHAWRLSDDSLPPALSNGSGFAIHLALLR